MCTTFKASKQIVLSANPAPPSNDADGQSSNHRNDYTLAFVRLSSIRVIDANVKAVTTVNIA